LLAREVDYSSNLIDWDTVSAGPADSTNVSVTLPVNWDRVFVRVTPVAP